MRNFWLFLIVSMLGCSSDDLPTYPVQTPGAPTVPNKPIVIIVNYPKAAVKDTSWKELGPQGFDFNTNVHFTTTQDTTAFRYGWKSERFEVSQGECHENDCFRTPVYERKEFGEGDTGLAREGDEYWYAWSFYVPQESFQPWAFFGQIMMPPASSGGGYEPLWMFMKRSGMAFCMVFDFNRNRNPWNCNDSSTGNIILLEDSEFTGKWHDIVLHIKFTSSSKGFTEVWVNGLFKGRYDGYTLTPSRRGAVMKYGIYRHSTSRSTIIYYDEMRKGKTREEVDIRVLVANK